MRLITANLICLVLLQALKGPAVVAEPHQSCQLSGQLEKECLVYVHQVTKPMLRYFEQVTQKIDKHSTEMEDKDNQIKNLKEQNIEFQMHIKQLEQKVVILQNEKTSYKSREDTMADVLEELKKQQILIEQLSMNRCDIENVKLKTKNKRIQNLEEKLIIVQNENTDYKFREASEVVAKVQQICELEEEDKKKKRSTCLGQDTSGVHGTTLTNGYSLDVLCNSDIAGSGWIVIQQRVKGGVDFYRDWATYRDGFGDFWDGDFFLGLDKIHRLTADQPHELYIHMMRFDGTTYFARYDEFAISGEEDDYRLSKLGTFEGPIFDYMIGHKNMKFSTYDRDNDVNDDENCAESRHGGWWYEDCAVSNLNGKYFHAETDDPQSNFWEGSAALKQVKMMIRPKVV